MGSEAQDTERAQRRTAVPVAICVFATAFLVVLLLQSRWNAPRNEFGVHPDEAGHYVTGLMVRDYVTNGFPGSPVGFARTYYGHYPKVAIGQWPPMFYVCQAAWTLVFGVSRASILMFLAACTSLLAVAVYRGAEEALGWWGAATAVCFVLANHFVQRYSCMLMTEVLLSFVMLCAALAWGRFQDTRQSRYSILFGVLASCAILTKGSGYALAFVPPLSVAIGRRWDLPRQRAFWVPLAIVVLLCAPWTLFTIGQVRGTWLADAPTLSFTVRAIPFFLHWIWYPTRWGLLGLAIAGVAVTVGPRKWRLTEGDIGGRWAALAALATGVYLLNILLPTGFAPRHLTPLYAPLGMFAAAACVGIARLLVQRGVRRRVAIGGLVILAAAFLACRVILVPLRADYGFRPAVVDLLTDPALSGATFFISSDSSGEGQFISELAMREARPRSTVLRASKEVADATWLGGDYELRFESTDEFLAHLAQRDVTIVIVDQGTSGTERFPHHDFVEDAVAMHPQHFERIGEYDTVKRNVVWGHGIRVYRFLSNIE